MSFRGTRYLSLSEEWVIQRKLGGIAFFASNAPRIDSLKKLIGKYKESTQKNKYRVPLFIATDHEPGQFMAIRLGHRFENNYSALSKIKSTEKKMGYVHETSKLLAENLKDWGFNTTFYPVLDINYIYSDSSQKGPVGHRAFSNKKELVAALGQIAVETTQKSGILATIKHYPGHGDTITDSHQNLPVIKKDFDSLWKSDLYPFRKAIEKEPAFMMAAHILLPAMDKNYPVTMSDFFLKKVARQKMNFKGILITDDMMMGAMIKNYSLKEAVYLSVLNGMDMILITRRFKEADSPENIHRFLSKKMKSDEYFRQRVTESCERVIRVKYKYGIN